MESLDTTQFIAVDQIKEPDGHNRKLDHKHVEYLASDIKRHGLRHPITVVESETGYDAWAGLHRLAATRKLGSRTIECKILSKDTAEAELLAISIAENRVRKNETFSETLYRIDRIMELEGCSHTAAASKASVGKAFASKCRCIENNLCEDAKTLVNQHPKKIGISIAYEVARHARSEAEQIELLESIIDGELTRDMLKKQFARPQTIKTIQLVTEFDGIEVNVKLPVKDASYEQLSAAITKLKAELDKQKRNKTPIHLIGEFMNAQTGIEVTS